MRTVALVALLLTACGMPFKYQTYQIPPQHADVLWVYKAGSLWRCWHDGHPICQQAAMINAHVESPPRAQTALPGKQTASRQAWPPEPDYDLAKQPPATRPTPEPAPSSGPQYPDYSKP